jgi:hypothetical protein
MSNTEIATYIKSLSEKMDRYEAHRIELKKDVKTVSDRQNEIVTLLAGSDLNGKKGVLNLIDEIDKRTRELENENKLIQKDMETAKFWGRGTAGILFASILVIIKSISDKL